MVLLVLGVFVFLAVGGITYSAYLLFNPTRTASDRLAELSAGGEESAVLDIITVDGNDGDSDSFASKFGSLAAASTEEERSKQRLRLLQAGYKGKHALEIFNGLRVSLALGLPMVVAPIVYSATWPWLVGVTFGSALLGYYGPELYISNTVTKRQKLLLGSFPDALDMLVSCVEAGLGMDAAFRRVAAEMETAAPELSREFQLVNHQISAGVPRVDALRQLQTRTGLDEIRALVNMLAQAERFGTSIAKSLRIHARMSREKRMSRAEEEAAQVSPKLTVVMILFLLPVLIMFLMGPAMITVYETFYGAGAK